MNAVAIIQKVVIETYVVKIGKDLACDIVA